ncbi:Tyrosine kinase receptor Cad96Ca [Liparis tanakae]|uniref:Tyrosine kinase receptor Cad96Ca n=1 Tax=Liparis tanakae TaxID=230148 RepID=A0A4Z2HDQ6_9TELE|nr:Tyrosine kinase receptor Cad96Ca [Liparis tanakae]
MLQSPLLLHLFKGPHVTKSELNLLQLIKSGKEGVFYQARMTRGTCKGHSMFTCKISKEGVRPKHVDMEASIMRKLVHHKNILQLLDWNTTEEPYLLIMEHVGGGTLKTFLQSNRVRLSADPELQSLLTIASYHVALAMQHLRSKRRVPLRWYPPEYFKNSYYCFKGDVWAFGIVLWEMQTFGTLPYPNLETLHIMRDCWLDLYRLRPSFTDVVCMLESIMESDADYVDVENPQLSVKDEDEYREAECLQAASILLEDTSPM